MEVPGSAEGKRGPGRPPVRLTGHAGLPGARVGPGVKRARAPGGLKPEAAAPGLETNALIGRKIWCVPLWAESRHECMLAGRKNLLLASLMHLLFVLSTS